MFDQQFRSRFEWLREPAHAAAATPPLLIAFDVLYVKGRDIASGRCVSGARVAKTCSPARTSCIRCAASRPMAWRRGRRSSRAAAEGYIRKDEASVYMRGPTRSWLK